jgi:intracellular septation protein
MSAPRPVSPLLRGILEYGPVLVFAVGYFLYRDAKFTLGGTEYGGFIAVTAVFVPLMVAATLILWRLTGKVSRMQVAVTVLVVIFGGLSVWLNDERFIKMKPTIVFALFAILLWIGLARGQSWLQALLDGAFEMEQAGWMILTRRLALFFAALAVANEVIWRFASTGLWVAFDTFGQTLALFAFFISQAGVLKRHGAFKDDA